MEKPITRVVNLYTDEGLDNGLCLAQAERVDDRVGGQKIMEEVNFPAIVTVHAIGESDALTNGVGLTVVYIGKSAALLSFVILSLG